MSSWPSTLPPLDYPHRDHGYQRTPQQQAIASSVDAGPPKVRRRFTAGTVRVKFTLRLTETQLQTLRDFYYNTVQVVLPFDWTDPGTHTTVSYRFAAGATPVEHALGGGMWDVTIELEQLP